MRKLRRSHLHDGSLVLSMASAWLMKPVSEAVGVNLFAVGMGVFCLGLAVQLWSKAALRRNRELSNRGPYALCRHPFYLGNAVFDLSLCLMSGNLLLVVLYPFVFALAYGPTIRKEEAFTRELFGEAHETYCRTTPLFFPTSSRFLRDWRTPLSFKVLLAEKEVSRTLRHLSYPLLIWVSGDLLRNPDRWKAVVRVSEPLFWQVLAVVAAFGISASVHQLFERKPKAAEEPKKS